MSSLCVVLSGCWCSKFLLVCLNLQLLISRLEQAERELAAVMAVLQEKQQKLADVEATIAKLEATYDASLSEKIELEDSIALTSARLARSTSLTSALGDEQVRWESIVKVSIKSHVCVCF